MLIANPNFPSSENQSSKNQNYKDLHIGYWQTQ